MRLAVCGPRFAGKTTLTKALEERGFFVLNYTDLLKEYAIKALAALGITVTMEELKANKEKYRQFIIEVGHHLGFDDGFGVDELIERIPEGEQHVIFDNVRYPAQFDRLEAAGFTLVRLTTPEPVRIARAMSQLITRDEYLKGLEDPSEHGMDHTLYEREMFLSVNGLIDDVVDELLETIAGLEEKALAEELVHE